MAEEVLVVTRDGPLMTLRINRPANENRLNLSLLTAFLEHLPRIDRDPDIGAVVIRGTGETFCCGGDVAEFAVGDAAAYRTFAQKFAGLHQALVRLSKPVLAAVNGDVRAGGMSLLSVCDVAVARSSVRFAMPEIQASLWPIMAMVSLNRVLPRKRAFELYYFGESFDAQRALSRDLVNWVVSDDAFEETVRQRAVRLAALPPVAVRAGRNTFADIDDLSYDEAFEASGRTLVELLTDPASVEALARHRRSP